MKCGRLDLGSHGEAGWEGDEAILLRQRVMGAGLCSRISSFSLSAWWGLGNQDGGVAHHLASCFFHPAPPHPLAPWEAPKPSFLI